RRLHLLELARGAEVEPEGVVDRRVAVAPDGEVGEARDAEPSAGDGLVDAGRDAIAEALADAIDLLLHAERHVDEEDDVGLPDLGHQLEIGADGRSVDRDLDARHDARYLGVDGGVRNRRSVEIGPRAAADQDEEGEREEASRRGPGGSDRLQANAPPGRDPSRPSWPGGAVRQPHPDALP